MADQVFTDSDFKQKVLESKIPVLVDFWAPWCAPCRIVSPIIDELAKEYADKVSVGKVNADENSQAIGEYGIMSIPTVILFKNGKPVKSLIGAQSKQSYKKAIDEVLAHK